MISTSEIHHVPPSQNHITADPNESRQSSRDAVPMPRLGQGLPQDQPQDQSLRPSIMFKPLVAQSEYIAASHAQNILECPFYGLSCSLSFNNFIEWQAHSISHFKKVSPPQNIQCCFCNKRFSDINAIETWKAYMRHLAYHQREGYRMVDARPDFDLYKYMFEKKLIPSTEYRSLQMTPAYTTRTLPDLTEFNSYRYKDPWSPLNTRLASPGLEIPGSSVFPINPQHNTVTHSARKRRLASEEKDHAKFVRTQGVCAECRRRKKRVFDLFFQYLQMEG